MIGTADSVSPYLSLRPPGAFPTESWGHSLIHGGPSPDQFLTNCYNATEYIQP